MRTELDRLLGEPKAGRSSALEEITCVTPFWHQLRWIIYRSFKNFLGFPRVTRIQAFITVILAVSLGIAFRVLRNDCTEVQTRASLLFLLTIFQCITSVSAGELFVIDRNHFLHEHTSGYYRVSSYFLGKLLGIITDVKGFFTMFFTVMMLAYSASSLPLCFKAEGNAAAVPTLSVTIYFVFMLALMHNEFLGQNFCLENNTAELRRCHNYVMKEEPLKMSSNNDPVTVPMIEINPSDHLEMDTSDLNSLAEEAVLSFHNISYQETVQSGFAYCKSTCVIERLSNIRLLDVLAARKDPRGLSGDILINGKPRPANFTCTSGYVPQNDALMPNMTVRENVEFSAALRLPMTMTRDEKRRRINEVLKLLCLDKESNVKISASSPPPPPISLPLSPIKSPSLMSPKSNQGSLTCGKSKDHPPPSRSSKPRSKELRKRTSIAMELVTEHPILFLDDPTTGLDLSTTTDIISVLRRMSRRGRTIIFSIYRPPYSIFRLFDSLTLVASGKVMFHGPVQEALEYFKSAGYNYDSHNNPADFFLDVINGHHFSALFHTEEDGHESDERKDLTEIQHHVTEELANIYAQSSLYSEMRTELDSLLGEQNAGRSSALEEITWVTPFWHQLWWIICRSFKNFKDFPKMSIIKAFIIFILTVYSCITLHVLRNDCTEIHTSCLPPVRLGISPLSLSCDLCLVACALAGLLFVLTVFQCLISVTAGEVLMIDRDCFPHEYTSGYYRVSSYFLGKLLGELVPRRVLPIIIFTVILFSIAGINTDVKGFFAMIFTIMMLTCSASSTLLSPGAGQIAAGVPTTFLVTIYFVIMLAFLHNELLGQNFCPENKTAEVSRCQNFVM
ncbi:ATP-binding cassette sub-family G member 3 [Microtus ochrogaster]|uniref:ATP-binding cassette sub-family G member 3 n=1 Tax=Microtus ochrogaster TaxID=79684 RepID=A0A8J6KJP8_MICOH|nr:ATP-binding cassette sub-family G member 3 [Microtus ochrogaster]